MFTQSFIAIFNIYLRTAYANVLKYSFLPFVPSFSVVSSVAYAGQSSLAKGDDTLLWREAYRHHG